MTLFQRRLPSLPPFPLFDVHVHLGPSDTGQLYYPHLTGEEYAALMEASNIEQAFAFAPTRTDGYRQANRDLRTWTEASGSGIRPFARLGGRHVALNEPQLWVLRKKVSHYLRGTPPDLDTLEDLKHFAGVKLLPHLDGLPGDDGFAHIAELRLPVLVHGGRHSPPEWIEQAILPHVRGPLIIAHLGSYPGVAPMLEVAVDVARRHANVYLDTSGAWVSNFIRYAAKHVPGKILFGSDAPLAHPLVAWQHVASVVKDDAVLERIGYATAQRLFERTGTPAA